MRLTTHTDYGLRLLMFGAEACPLPVSVGNVASKLNVSRNHLSKVAQNLTKAGILETTRGRSGGFRLKKRPQDIRVGEVVRILESETGLVECMRAQDSTCPLTKGCRLPRLFNKASEAFFQILDDCTLDDLVADNAQVFRLLEAR